LPPALAMEKVLSQSGGMVTQQRIGTMVD